MLSLFPGKLPETIGERNSFCPNTGHAFRWLKQNKTKATSVKCYTTKRNKQDMPALEG